MFDYISYSENSHTVRTAIQWEQPYSENSQLSSSCPGVYERISPMSCRRMHCIWARLSFSRRCCITNLRGSRSNRSMGRLLGLSIAGADVVRYFWQIRCQIEDILIGQRVSWTSKIQWHMHTSLRSRACSTTTTAAHIRHSARKLNSRYTAMSVIRNRSRRELAVSEADVRVDRDVVETKISLRLLRPRLLSVLCWTSRHLNAHYLRIPCILFRKGTIMNYIHLLMILSTSKFPAYLIAFRLTLSLTYSLKMSRNPGLPTRTRHLP